MIEHENVRLRPRVQIAGDLELRRLVEQAIEWNYLSIVIEGGDGFGFARADIDDTVAVHCHIFAGYIQRAGHEDGLHPWAQLAIGVDQFESAVQRECLSVSDVREPDYGPGDSRPAILDCSAANAGAAARLICRKLDRRIGGDDSIEIDSSGEPAAADHWTSVVGPRWHGYHGGAGRDAALLRRSRLRCARFLVRRASGRQYRQQQQRRGSAADHSELRLHLWRLEGQRACHT